MQHIYEDTFKEVCYTVSLQLPDPDSWAACQREPQGKAQ